MMSSAGQGDNEPQDHAKNLEQLIAALSLDAENEQLVSEIGVLQSIYGDGSIRVWNGTPTNGTDAIRYQVYLDLPPPHDSLDTRLKILVSLPPTYPSTSPPQLQLLSRYIGPFSVDSNLFGSILRTFISSTGGVEWLENTLCVFDGLENLRERCANWYSERLSEEKAHDLLREGEHEETHKGSPSRGDQLGLDAADTLGKAEIQSLPDGISIVVAEPIVDRKSIFIGRACQITHPSQVPIVLSHFMSDRRIARAAHPIINAWRCKVDGVLHQDNDDDKETAAGGRLAHLLQILAIDNVLVVVTRYFGGIHLGPDRFKHINQAARNALDLGGFLDAHEDRKNTSKLKRKG